MFDIELNFFVLCASVNSYKLYKIKCIIQYSVKQSDRNRSKTDKFQKDTIYEQQVQTSSEHKITFARHEYGQVNVFRIRMRSLVQHLQPLEKCQFYNCSHLIASQCIRFSSMNHQVSGYIICFDIALTLLQRMFLVRSQVVYVISLLLRGFLGEQSIIKVFEKILRSTI